MTNPNPQNPNDPMYQFIDTQPESEYPATPDSSLSHFTVRQFTPESITNALPVVVTKQGHGLSNGQAIRATKFISIPVANATGMYQLNNRLFYVLVLSEDTFALVDNNNNYIDGRNFTAYIAGGEFTVSGPTLPIVNPSRFPPAGVPDPFI